MAAVSGTGRCRSSASGTTGTGPPRRELVRVVGERQRPRQVRAPRVQLGLELLDYAEWEALLRRVGAHAGVQALGVEEVVDAVGEAVEGDTGEEG